MTNVIEAKARTVRFYAAGGTGIDLLRSYREAARIDRVGVYADEQETYIDTSNSNLHGVSMDNVYRLKNIEGGGKDREKVKAAFIPVVPDLLLKHPPADLNVILASLSGGTGSAIAPILAGHLLKAGQAVVLVVMADHTSSKSELNVINTMTDLESVSKQLQKAVVLHYTQNDPEKSLLQNDTEPMFVMGALSILGSGKNNRLDLSDVNNFVNFPAVTHHTPGLAQLHVTVKSEDLAQHETIASFAALLRSEDQALPRVQVDYDTVGYLPMVPKGYDCDFFFAVTPGMSTIIDDLKQGKHNLTLKRKAVEAKSSLLEDGPSLDGNSGISFD